MGTLRITAEEFGLFQQYPLPWWSPTARAKLGRVAPGSPAVEMDVNDNPTGYLLLSHPDIDEWDQYTLDVMRAGWELANENVEGMTLVSIQQLADWEAWAALSAALDAGLLTVEHAIEQARQYMLALGRSLEIPDPVEDETGLA